MKDSPTVRFRALSQEIERLISMGYEMKEVHEAHNDMLKVSYRHFTKLVNDEGWRKVRSRKRTKTRPAVSLPLPQPKLKRTQQTEDTENGRTEFRKRIESIKLPDGWPNC